MSTVVGAVLLDTGPVGSSASLADACLIRISEMHPASRVFTLDSDFHIYRQHGRRVIPLIQPG